MFEKCVAVRIDTCVCLCVCVRVFVCVRACMCLCTLETPFRKRRGAGRASLRRKWLVQEEADLQRRLPENLPSLGRM